jgi:carbamoyl-phosphate synthase large subunit
VTTGQCDAGCDISVRCKGGELIVRYTPEGVTLTGDTRLVYTGETEF